MAVVQISRIQQRRGKKNSSTGFPQLASGEIGWAIDTQELYIGNGAISEGAPYVGNTQILTEHVNILDFIGAYQYQRNNPLIQTGPTFQTPIKRTIQERLDDLVSVKAFGAVGNGIVDDTAAIQRALDELYLNTTKANPTMRVILHFEPGEYIISSELKIPPFAHLYGSGIDSTIIHLVANGNTTPLMRTVAGDSTPGHYTPFGSMPYEQRPKFITIEGMTLKTGYQDTILVLDNTDSTIIEKVKFKGTFVNKNTPPGQNQLDLTLQAGILTRSTSGVHSPDSVCFQSCIFENTGFGIYNEGDSNALGFYDCTFFALFDAINIGGDVFGAVNTKISGCYFDEVDRYGIYIKKGYGNTSSNNKFMKVGNDGEGFGNPVYSIIKFDETNNQSVNDYFHRNSLFKDQTLYGLKAFEANIRTRSLVTDPTSFSKIVINTSVAPVEFFRFPVYDSSTYVIDYVINKTTVGTAVRTGTLHLTVNYPALTYRIKDDYSYTGDSTVENIVFSANIYDYNGDTTYETLVLKMYNPAGNGIGTMNYTYRTMTK